MSYRLYRASLAFICTVTVTLMSHAQDASSPESKGAGAVASVNGERISKGMLDFLGGKREQGLLSASPVQQEQLLNDLITTELLYQAALNAKTQEKPQNRIELALAHKTLLSQLYVMDFLANLDITEKMLRETYDSIQSPAMVHMKTWEFDSRGDAEKFLMKVADSNNAPELVGESQPWQALEYLPFANDPQAKSMNAGDWIREPVASGSIWQVWRCVERSEMTKPPFDDAREGIRQELAQEKLRAHIAELTDQALIVMNP